MKCPKCGTVGFCNEQFDYWIEGKFALGKLIIHLECKNCDRHDKVEIDLFEPSEELLKLFPQWYQRGGWANSCND